MDSITQAVLGGTIAVVVTRGEKPRKAVMWGAIIATLPDRIYAPPKNLINKRKTS